MGEIIGEMVENKTAAMALSIHGLCSEEEVQFLYGLALSAPMGLTFVELGTYQGRTAAVLCAAASETDSQVITISNVPEEGVEDRLSGLGFYPRVVIGDSAVIPNNVHRISLLFIDSEHTRERLYKELDAWLPLLVEGGILAFHDYNENGHGKVMTPAIDERINNKTDECEYLGLARWLIGFRRRSEKGN